MLILVVDDAPVLLDSWSTACAEQNAVSSHGFA